MNISKICDKHGEYISKISVIGKGRFAREFNTGCPECKKEDEERKQSEKKEELDRYTTEKIKSMGIPNRYSNCEISELIAKNDKQYKIIKRCKGYVEKFEELEKTGTSLIFTGSPGTGKTLIALSMIPPIIKKMVSAIKEPLFNNFQPHYFCVYKNIYDMFAELKSTYRDNSCESEYDIIKKYINTNLLIIDEIGAQFNSDYEVITLFRIINARYENLKPTFLISNLSESDLVNYIGERIIDRFKENNGAIFVFDWESLRR